MAPEAALCLGRVYNKEPCPEYPSILSFNKGEELKEKNTERFKSLSIKRETLKQKYRHFLHY
jgi:hypothetical protein